MRFNRRWRILTSTLMLAFGGVYILLLNTRYALVESLISVSTIIGRMVIPMC